MMTWIPTNRRLARTISTIGLAAAVVLAPALARATQLDTTCSIASTGITSGSEALRNNLVGQIIGVTGMIANLVCFVGDPRCTCLRRSTDTDFAANDRLIEEVAAVVAGCAFSSDRNRNFSGVIQEGALNACR